MLSMVMAKSPPPNGRVIDDRAILRPVFGVAPPNA
jgi:hypothetical protein